MAAFIYILSGVGKEDEIYYDIILMEEMYEQI